MAFRCVVEKGRVTFGATSASMLEHHLEAKTEVLPDGTIRATVIIPGRKKCVENSSPVSFGSVLPSGFVIRKASEQSKSRRKKSANGKTSPINR